MTADRVIRMGTAGAVLLVAAIAAVVSFVHIERLAVTHGQVTLAAYLLPLSIDGTVAAASLVMLRSARDGEGTPWLARVMLVLAVAATLACNVGYGAAHGLAGALLSGWPAVALIGCTEMAIGAIRRTRPVPAADTPAATADTAVAVHANGHDPAVAHFADDLARGEIPGIRRIAREMHCGQPRARQIQERIQALTPQVREGS